MQLQTLLLAALAGEAYTQVINAKSYTGWDWYDQRSPPPLRNHPSHVQRLPIRC